MLKMPASKISQILNKKREPVVSFLKASLENPELMGIIFWKWSKK
jgi:hypothetical protein